MGIVRNKNKEFEVAEQTAVCIAAVESFTGKRLKESELAPFDFISENTPTRIALTAPTVEAFAAREIFLAGYKLYGLDFIRKFQSEESFPNVVATIIDLLAEVLYDESKRR